MSSAVLDLQQEILKPECDILNALRKARLIASKLDLKEFDTWVQLELNGYANADSENIPNYRSVKGTLKAFNPARGWIPVQCPNDELEKTICELKMWQPISELQELYQHHTNETLMYQFPAGQMEMLNEMCKPPIPVQFALHISAYCMKSIIEQVKNCILEWTIRLENKGILGEGMRFSQEETAMAQKLPQTIHNYYGNVVNGSINQSQVVSGDNNTISFNYGQADDFIQKVKNAINDELPSGENRETADELVAEVETKLAAQAKPGIIKATLVGLKEFLIGAGANVAGTLVAQYLQQGIDKITG